MSWGCYRHECDVDAPGWTEKEAALCESQAAADGGRTWGSRQIGICPWCVEEMMSTVRRLERVIEIARDHDPQLIDGIMEKTT